VVPFARSHCGAPSRNSDRRLQHGGYHAANFFFRHPQVFDTLVSISGLFQLSLFIGDYSDDLVYLQLADSLFARAERSPLSSTATARARSSSASGRALGGPDAPGCAPDEGDPGGEGNPGWIDFWGYDVNHDWPWWQKMLPYILGSWIWRNASYD
jgi:hypothetical protein